MLSAIAARKAAQAATLASVSQPTPSTSKTVDVPDNDSNSDTEHLETAVLLSLQPKRKAIDARSAETSVARKKRRKKSAKFDASQARYYQLENEAVRDDEKPDSSSSSSSDEAEGGYSNPDFSNVIQSHPPRSPVRAWSPSRPPASSSDDDVDYPVSGALPPEINAETGFRSGPTQTTRYHAPQHLSFVPQLNKNVFYLDGHNHEFLSGRKGTIVSLSENETMALVGVYSLTVLSGIVSLMGADVDASSSKSHIIFAPRCSPVPIIQAIASGDLDTPNLLYEINLKVDQKSVLILLEDVSTGIENIGRVCKTFENAFELSFPGEGVLNLTGAKLLTSIPRSLQPFQLPDSWKAAFSSLSIFSSTENDEDAQNLDPVTVWVRGRKRTGKSTLARTLVNRLLNRYRRVAFLECDVGQTEFTPPGLVSLHVIDGPVFGPPFTHPALPYASHYIGATSPRNNPEHYLSAVSALMETYKLEVQYPAPEDELYETDADECKNTDVVPLVVNIMGWTKGLGADLARRIEELVTPTHVFCIGSLTSNMNESSARSMMSTRSEDDRSGSGPRSFEVEAIPPDMQSARYSAADWRTLSLVSYFHSIPSSSQRDLLPIPHRNRTSASHDSRTSLCTWDFRLPLIAQVPYAIAIGEAIDNVFLVGAGMEDVVPSEVSRVLNGAIVALVSCQPDVQEDHSRDARESRLPYTQGAVPPDPSTSNCIGLALVRGVSPSLFDVPYQTENENSRSINDVLHILTPVPPNLIASAEARSFVKGEIELPVWGMLDYRELERDGARPRGTDGVPYLQWSKSDAIGAERRRVRRNIMRKGQM